MAGPRRLQILERLVGGGAFETERLCVVGADITRLTGAGIMLISGDITSRSACSSNKVRALMEQLQFDVGEGPCVYAYRGAHPVVEACLAGPRRTRWRW